MASSGHSKAEDIISHDCCISSDIVPHEMTIPTTTTNTQASQVIEEEPGPMPSAPCAPIAPVINAPIVQYPNLQPIRISNALIEEQKTPIVYKERVARSPGFALASSRLKPFTSEQLRQIYKCSDLELVKQFELDFLMNTLLESSETDPLHVALQEYYELQGKLSSNLHDIKDKRKDCLDTQQLVWTREPVTRTFSASCGDGNVVRESVTFE